MDKENVVHIFNEILVIKMNEIMPFSVIWMDLEIIILRQSNPDKDKYYIVLLNELIYKAVIDSQT